jgi:uncharacterized repeat protein (TIGR03803 family)
MNSTLGRMFSQKISRGAMAVLVVTLFTTLAATRPALTQTETTLYNFCSITFCPDGTDPHGFVVMDSSGNLYGTTFYGGAYGKGTVYKLATDGTETVLYSFGASSSSDGKWPMAGVILDGEGNLYGTTAAGGTNDTNSGGAGIAFKISPEGTETILHEFGASSKDGTIPTGSLLMDHSGNLYGTTQGGGSNYYGTIFKISAGGTESILHTFAASDGEYPPDNLISDKEGNMYGTAPSGGSHNDGTVFEITPKGVFTVLYNFGASSTDGTRPFANLVFDGAGDLYGTTETGGANGGGTIFKLTPGSGGTWTESIVFGFEASGTGVGGHYPTTGVVLDGQGYIYGTTYYGGKNSVGTVYEITPAGRIIVLYAFTSASGNPNGGLLLSGGTFYGVSDPASANTGELYEITP